MILSLLIVATFGVAVLEAQVLVDEELSEAFYMKNPGQPDSYLRAAVRIVDGQTHQPIPGAQVLIDREAPTDPPLKLRANDRGWLHLNWSDPALRIPFGLDVSRMHWLPGDGQLVTADGYMPTRAGILNGFPLFELSRGEQLDLRVVDPSGNPLPGVRVGLIDEDSDRQPARTAITDARGRIRFESGAPALSDARVWIEGSDIESGEYRVWDFQSGERRQDIVIKRAPDLAGLVVDMEGNPVLGARIDALPSRTSQDTATDSEGRFRLTGVSAESFRLRGPDVSAEHAGDLPFLLRPPPGVDLRLVLSEDGGALIPICDREITVRIPEIHRVDLRLQLNLIRLEDGFVVSELIRREDEVLAIPSSGTFLAQLFDRDKDLVFERQLGQDEIEGGRIELGFRAPRHGVYDFWFDDEEAEKRRVVPFELRVPSGLPVHVHLVARGHREKLDHLLRWIRSEQPDDIYETLGLELDLTGLDNPVIEITRDHQGWPAILDRGDDVSRYPIAVDQERLDIKLPIIALRLPRPVGPGGDDIELSCRLFDAKQDLDIWDGRSPAAVSRVPEGELLIFHAGPLYRWLHLDPADEDLQPIWVDLRGLDPEKSEHEVRPPSSVSSTESAALVFQAAPETRLSIRWPLLADNDDQLLVWVNALRTEYRDEFFGKYHHIYEGETVRIPRTSWQDLAGRQLRAELASPTANDTRLMPLHRKLGEGSQIEFAWAQTRLRLVIENLPERTREPHRFLLMDNIDLRWFDEEQLSIHGLDPGLHEMYLAVPGRKARRIVFKIEDRLEIRVSLNPDHR